MHVRRSEDEAALSGMVAVGGRRGHPEENTVELGRGRTTSALKSGRGRIPRKLTRGGRDASWRDPKFESKNSLLWQPRLRLEDKGPGVSAGTVGTGRLRTESACSIPLLDDIFREQSER